MKSWDDVAQALRDLRVRAGNPSYAELAKRVKVARAERGETSPPPSKVTVYECFKDGRRRMDLTLLSDLGRALELSGEDGRLWDEACFAVQHRIDASQVVSVTTDPAPMPDFIGRRDDLAWLGGRADRICLVHGIAGMGKTELALTAAQSQIDAGAAARILLADLRGFEADRPPADPMALLDELVRSLTGGLGARLLEPARQRAVLTEALVEHRCVLVLDDAASTAQVLPLLPDPGSVPVLITSRLALEGLPCDSLLLAPLAEDDAIALLAAGLEDEVTTDERSALAGMADRLGHQPLALQLTLGRMASQPDWSLADHCAALDLQLEVLRAPGRVHPSLDLSIQRTSSDAQRLLRLFADVPCRALTLDALLDLAGLTGDRGATALDELLRANLVRADAARFDMHGLVRTVAAAGGLEADPQSVRDAARRRLLDHYVKALAEATAAAGCFPLRLTAPESTWTATAAQAWLAAEHANIVQLADPVVSAVQPESAIELSELASRYLEVAGIHGDARILHGHALATARRLGDTAATARAHTYLAQALARLGEYDDALAEAEAALALVDAEVDPETEASALNVCGVIAYHRGENELALRHLEAVLEVVRTGRTSRSAASPLGNVAAVLFTMGQHTAAAELHREAHRIAADEQDWAIAAFALANLTDVHLAAGDAEAAATSARAAISLSIEHALAGAESVARSNLGNALAALGRFDEARREQAIALRLAAEQGGRAEEASLLNNLGDLEVAAGDREAAEAAYLRAADLARTVGAEAEFTRAESALQALTR